MEVIWSCHIGCKGRAEVIPSCHTECKAGAEVIWNCYMNVVRLANQHNKEIGRCESLTTVETQHQSTAAPDVSLCVCVSRMQGKFKARPVRVAGENTTPASNFKHIVLSKNWLNLHGITTTGMKSNIVYLILQLRSWFEAGKYLFWFAKDVLDLHRASKLADLSEKSTTNGSPHKTPSCSFKNGQIVTKLVSNVP